MKAKRDAAAFYNRTRWQPVKPERQIFGKKLHTKGRGKKKLFEWKEVKSDARAATAYFDLQAERDKQREENAILMVAMRKACTHLTIALRAYDKTWRA